MKGKFELSGLSFLILLIAVIAMMIFAGIFIFVLTICCLLGLAILALVLVLFWLGRRRAIQWQRAARARRDGRRVYYRAPGGPRQDGPPIVRTSDGRVPEHDAGGEDATSGPEGRIIDAEVEGD